LGVLLVALALDIVSDISKANELSTGGEEKELMDYYHWTSIQLSNKDLRNLLRSKLVTHNDPSPNKHSSRSHH